MAYHFKACTVCTLSDSEAKYYTRLVTGFPQSWKIMKNPWKNFFLENHGNLKIIKSDEILSADKMFNKFELKIIVRNKQTYKYLKLLNFLVLGKLNLVAMWFQQLFIEYIL